MLYQNVRPSCFSEIVGHKSIVELLKKAVAQPVDKRPHAFLLIGNTGCGKTTFARILAKELGCDQSNLGVVEINSANATGVDSMRDVAESAQVAPMFGDAKAYIIDESQKMTSAAQECLLKVLEDCPKHVYFIFCTTDPQKLVAPLKNRCAKFILSSLRPSEIREVLSNACVKEKLTVTEDTIKAIAQVADGCPREALTLLEQVAGIENPAEVLQFLLSAETGSKEVIELCRELISKRANRWETCVRIYQKVDADPETIRLSVLGYLRKVLLGEKSLSECGRLAELIEVFSPSTYSGGSAQLVARIFSACLVD